MKDDKMTPEEFLKGQRHREERRAAVRRAAEAGMTASSAKAADLLAKYGVSKVRIESTLCVDIDIAAVDDEINDVTRSTKDEWVKFAEEMTPTSGGHIDWVVDAHATPKYMITPIAIDENGKEHVLHALMFETE